MFTTERDAAYACLCIFASETLVRGVMPHMKSAPNLRMRVRWFLIHALCNAVVAAHTMRDALKLTRMSGDACLPNQPDVSAVPITLTVALHAWHVAAYDLSSDDKFHHALFMPLIGIPGCLWDWGSCGNAQLWFMSGAPGGLIYTMSALQKCDLVLWVNEAAFTGIMTSLVRLPGALLACTQLLLALHGGQIHVPTLAVILQLTLSPFNAMYYAHHTLSRWHRKYSRAIAQAPVQHGHRRILPGVKKQEKEFDKQTQLLMPMESWWKPMQSHGRVCCLGQ